MVNVGLLDGEVAPGDWVLIHVGFALSRIDEEEAAATLRLLEQMGRRVRAGAGGAQSQRDRMSCDDPHGHCITCRDVGLEMRVVRVDEPVALCEAGDGERREVEIGLLDRVEAGDTVLVHADVALVRL